MTSKPWKSPMQKARQSRAKLKAEMEALKAKHHKEISIMAKEIDNQGKASEMTYLKKIDQLKAQLKAQHKKELTDASAEIWRQVGKYENSHIRYLDARIEGSAAKATSNHFELLYKNHLRRCIENGHRRAQHDPNYAVIRELLHAGEDLEKVDFMALSQKHREATLYGMTMIAEELGFRLKWDDGLKKAVEQSKPSVWNIAMHYPDMMTHTAQAMGEILNKVSEQATKDIQKEEDKTL